MRREHDQKLVRRLLFTAGDTASHIEGWLQDQCVDLLKYVEADAVVTNDPDLKQKLELAAEQMKDLQNRRIPAIMKEHKSIQDAADHGAFPDPVYARLQLETAVLRLERYVAEIRLIRDMVESREKLAPDDDQPEDQGGEWDDDNKSDSDDGDGDGDDDGDDGDDLPPSP